MIASILNNYPDPDKRNFTVYILLIEGESKSRELVHNTGRDLLVGKNFIDEKDPDIFILNKRLPGDKLDIDIANVYVDDGGYYRVDCKNNQYDSYNNKLNISTSTDKGYDWIHRVILYSFDNKYDSSKDDVEHIDRDKSNNKLENLRAVPKLYNVMKEYKHDNYKASEYFANIAKKVTYENFIKSALLALEDEGYTIIPPKDDDDDSSPVGVNV
jgi:hypothetical protein